MNMMETAQSDSKNKNKIVSLYMQIGIKSFFTRKHTKLISPKIYFQSMATKVVKPHNISYK